MHLNYEYLRNLVRKVIQRLEKDYSHIPPVSFKQELIRIVETEYNKLMGKVPGWLHESNVLNCSKDFENGVIAEKEKAKLDVENKCVLWEERWNSNRRWWRDPKWAVGIIVMVLLAVIGWWINSKNVSVTSSIPEKLSLNRMMMSERLELEQIMKTHRDKQYEAVIRSLEPNDILEIYHAFKTKSDTEKIELITRTCITEGGNCRNSNLFKGKINPESQVSLEDWEDWMENYEDTDESGVLVDDKIDSKIGVFVNETVSEWYYLCLKETRNMNPKEKGEYSLKLIGLALEHVYKTALPQIFDKKMINTFITQNLSHQ